MNPNKDNRTYLILTIILITLSVIGLYLYSLVPKETTEDNVIVDRSIVPEDIYSTPTPYIPYTNPQSPTLVPGTKGGIGEADGVLTTDTFTVAYSPDRKMYESREGSGTRYTLYSSAGNIAIHVGPSWSWVHPARVFSDDLKVAGQSTFVYKISSQTIVDFQVDKTKYTIQCIHGSSSALESECDQLLKDFQLK